MQIGNTGFWIRDCTTEPENGGLGVFAHAGAGATGTYVLGPAEHATKKAQALVVELPADARGNARSSIAGNRQHLGLDTTLAEGPYNFGWGLTRPDGERSPYQDGLLVSYAVARGGRTAPAPAAPDW